MSTGRTHRWSLVGGALLIGLGILFLLGQIFGEFDFWDTFWPFILVGIGVLLFAAMLSGGKTSAGLAIPASILTCLGLMMFLQNIFDRWETWSYSWTVILFSVGLGIYIKGAYGEQESSRRSGISLMKLAAVLFLIFGIFFEMIFSENALANYAFPIALILLGLFLLLRPSRKPRTMPEEISSPAPPPAPVESSVGAEIISETETPSQDQ